MNMVLLEHEHRLVRFRNVLTRVGTPVYDVHMIDVGRGFEAHDNANLQENAETSHKKKADKISKKQYLLQLPPEIADQHLAGDLHIHDLEYFGTRPFCQDWDLRYFFYYGLMPDGNGTKASVAGPAKRAEVGPEQVQVWRRSYAVRPPALEETDPRYPRYDPRYAGLDFAELPAAESLRDTLERTLPFWHETVAPAIHEGSRVLIVAHGNSLRALVKYLDQISDEEIPLLEIPTGVPLVYTLDDDLNAVAHRYLGVDSET